MVMPVAGVAHCRDSVGLLHPWSTAERESKWERKCVLNVLQLWGCAVCPTTPQRAGEEEGSWFGGWRKEPWSHLDFSLSEPYDVTDVSASGEWNEADLEWWQEKNTLRNYTGSSLLFCTHFRQHHTDKTLLKHFTALLHSTSHCFTHLSRCK